MNKGGSSDRSVNRNVGRSGDKEEWPSSCRGCRNDFFFAPSRTSGEALSVI